MTWLKPHDFDARCNVCIFPRLLTEVVYKPVPRVYDCWPKPSYAIPMKGRCQ
jgi:hypothetical protein